MKMTKKNHFSRVATVFQGRLLPEECALAGYAALIDTYDLKIPIPIKLAAISLQHRQYEKNNWSIYTPRYKPKETLWSHLTFALKHEGVNLAVLNALFKQIAPQEIEEWVRTEPVGSYSRRVWFLYEWLTETKLDLPDAKTGSMVDVLDPDQQYVGPTRASKRHRELIAS